MPTPAADYTVTATNVAGTDTFDVDITVSAVAPTNLSYASPVTYTVGTQITDNTPSNDGGAITSYAVSPALPSGLDLNTSTGVISGTPSAASTATDYTVTGTNSRGKHELRRQHHGESNAASALEPLLRQPGLLCHGSPISPNQPSVSGGAVDTYAVSPALPAGLSLSTSTGDITGTPTTVTAAADYTVTATNGAGSTNAVVNIEVVLGAPSNLTYSNNPSIAYVNQQIQQMAPSSQGGAVASYSVSPALPTGITLDTSTGVISGTPTTQQGFINYTVTATNSAGSTNATVSIVVY